MLAFGILWWFPGASCSVASASSPVPSFLHSHRIFIMAHAGWGTRLHWPGSRCRCYYFQYNTQSVTCTVWEFSLKDYSGFFSSTAFSCYQKLCVKDRHGGVSVSCCPTLEMKDNNGLQLGSRTLFLCGFACRSGGVIYAVLVPLPFWVLSLTVEPYHTY